MDQECFFTPRANYWCLNWVESVTGFMPQWCEVLSGIQYSVLAAVINSKNFSRIPPTKTIKQKRRERTQTKEEPSISYYWLLLSLDIGCVDEAVFIWDYWGSCDVKDHSQLHFFTHQSNIFNINCPFQQLCWSFPCFREFVPQKQQNWANGFKVIRILLLRIFPVNICIVLSWNVFCIQRCWLDICVYIARSPGWARLRLRPSREIPY